MDQDEDGCISFEEFANLVNMDDYEIDRELFLKNLFRELDKNKDGLISFKEYTNIQEVIFVSLEEMKANFDSVDKNKSGTINLERNLKKNI